MNNMYNTEEMMRALLAQQQATILLQLSSLLEDGVICIESSEPVLIQTTNHKTLKHEIKLEQAVKLTYKGKEVIESLKAENEMLNKRLQKIHDALAEYGYTNESM